MNKIDHFKIFVLCSSDVTSNVYHLHIKRIHSVYFSYIIIDDTLPWTYIIVISKF
jgi:hypothetical protein